GLLGILIAAIALIVLMRGGYGPFLKALLRGKRAGRRRRGKGVPGAEFAPKGAAATSGRGGSRAGYDTGYDDSGWDAPPRGSGFRGGYDERDTPRNRGPSRPDW
ncbi:MAG: hypothetical protein ACHQ4H_18265, partial [Ktedonobacterales bacterium]